MPRRAVYDAFTISDKEAGKEEKEAKQDPFIIRPQTSSSTVSAPTQQTTTPWSETSTQNTRKMIDVMPISNSLPSNDRSFDVSREAVIFSPPHCICDADLPTTSWSTVGRYNAPVKAAGDVSLSGPQLVPFIKKATARLSRVKAEGVQIRLRGLVQALEDQRLTEQFVQKLNFLVDALDRSSYEQAWREFVSLNENFESEMNSQWETGLKLLIRELLPQTRPSRVSSAGGHVRNQ